MPSERSKPSEITGENAARSKVRSISLATCWSPFCTTTSVMGSIASIPCASMARALGAEPAHGDLKVAEAIDAHAISRLDHRGGVELLHDGGPLELDADPELLAPIHQCVVPGALEPRAPARRGSGGALGPGP